MQTKKQRELWNEQALIKYIIFRLPFRNCVPDGEKV